MRSVMFMFRGLSLAAKSALLAVGLASPVLGQSPDAKFEGDPFPLDICVVMKGPLTKGATMVEVEGRELRVCCDDCADTVRQNPEQWLQAVDDRIKDQQREFYPLDTCLVDGEKLDDSDCLEFVLHNRLFRVCGDGCREKVAENPAKYFAMLNRAAAAKQKADYPLTACVVSGKPLGNDAVELVVGNQLVRLADAAAVAAFNQNPGEFLAKLREAWRKRSAK